MKTVTNILKVAFVLCLGITAMTLNAQTTHIVNNNAGTAADFTDLQAAIDAAADGDIIHIQQSSTTYGNITLDKALTLIGRSHSDASYSTDIGIIDLVEGCSNSTIKGLDISSIGDPFISGATYGTIENLVLQDNRIQTFTNFGIYRTFNNILMQGNIFTSSFSISSNTSNLLITNNIFLSSSLSFAMVDTVLFANNILGYFNGVQIANNTPDLLNISNCIFVIDRTSNRTANFSGAGIFQITNCLTYNYDANYNFATGSNITVTNSQENIDPLFTNRVGGTGSIGNSITGIFTPGLDELTLQATSPFVDEGIYEGYNYKPLGTPTGLPSLKIDSYDPTVPKNSDLTVTITAKTN